MACDLLRKRGHRAARSLAGAFAHGSAASIGACPAPNAKGDGDGEAPGELDADETSEAGAAAAPDNVRRALTKLDGTLPVLVIVPDGPLHDGPQVSFYYSAIATGPRTHDEVVDSLNASGEKTVGVLVDTGVGASGQFGDAGCHSFIDPDTTESIDASSMILAVKSFASTFTPLTTSNPAPVR